KALGTRDRVYVPAEVAAKFPACLVRAGDLVFPHRGAIGRVGIVGNEELLLSSSMMKLTVDAEVVHPMFVFYYFRGPGRDELLARASTVGTPGIAQPLASLRQIPIRFPELREQRAIAEALGALDDKIAANDRVISTAAQLARSAFRRAASEGDCVSLGEVASLVTRGIAPKYAEAEGQLVLNQKCVRNQTVSLSPARRMQPLQSRFDRVLQRDDILVNSTGQGTLGRVARWTLNAEATVDTHITLIRFNALNVDPVCAGYAVLALEKQIEGLAQGSTGQTELRRDLLSALELRIPSRERQREVSRGLTELDDLSNELRSESERLSQTRDELLPLLMSGKVRVKDAEKIVGEVV
ncbi:MAG: restriction endonuclease subunit S, partial [Nocardioides sp.]